MFILFGWDHQKSKSFGPLFKAPCEHCNNDVFWQLLEFSYWFTLFFIPIFPTSRKRMAICPTCSAGWELIPEEFENYKRWAQLNQSVINKEISNEEYKSRAHELETLEAGQNLKKLGGRGTK